MEINQRVVQIRKALGLNQSEFGKQLAIKQAYVSLIEIGHVALTEKLLKLICFQFGVSEHWLRTGEGNMFVETADDLVQQLCTKYSLDSQSQAVLECFLGLSDAQRAAIIDFAKAIAAKCSPATHTQED